MQKPPSFPHKELSLVLHSNATIFESAFHTFTVSASTIRTVPSRFSAQAGSTKLRYDHDYARRFDALVDSSSAGPIHVYKRLLGIALRNAAYD